MSDPGGGEGLALALADGEIDAEAEALGEMLADGLIEADPEALGDIDALALAD